MYSRDHHHTVKQLSSKKKKKNKKQVINLKFKQCYISINLGKNLRILALWDYFLYEFLTSCVNNGFQIILIEA